MSLITLRQIQLHFGEQPLLDNVDLTIEAGERLCLVGRNGSGKSTLLKVLAGEVQADDGQIESTQNLMISRLEQEVPEDQDHSVHDMVAEGLGELGTLLNEHDHLSRALGDPDQAERMDENLARFETLNNEIEARGAWQLFQRVDTVLSKLNLNGEQNFAGLSGGMKRRVLLARALVQEPDILLLDEPTNHLDAESVAWLERFLHDYDGTVVAITHDRYFLDNVAGWILELDRGHGIPFEGNYSQWLENKEKRLEMEAKQEAAHQKAIKHELEWVRTNAKGRQSKSKARLARFEEMSSQEFQKRNETNELYIPPGPRLGDKVIEVDGISKAFGDRLLYENVSFHVPPGAIVGIIGGNGAGKSTLFKMIAGMDKPDSGTITVGETVELAYVDQMRDLDGSKTVWEELSDGQDIIKVGNYETPSRAYVGRFNFKGTDQQKRVGDLSGGERNRLHLAKLLKQGGNVLLLDEPTNDLDVETLRALEEALLNFPGSALVISHDRWFLDRVATHILAFEDDGEVVYFEGNFTDYDADFKKRKGDSAMQPKRMKYKKLA